MTEEGIAVCDAVIAMVVEDALNGDRVGVHEEHLLPVWEGRKRITVGFAQEHLAFESWGGQRNRRPHKTTEYAVQMQEHLWRYPDSAIVVVSLNGRLYVLNGQHRLAGVAESGVEIKSPYQFYEVCCEEEMEIIHGNIDRPLPRTVGETLGGLVAAELNLSHTQVTRATSAVELIARGFQVKGWRVAGDNPTTNNAEIRRRALRDWSNQICLYADLIAGSKSVERMGRSDVQSVALVTLRWQRDRAVEFWRAVALDDGLRNNTGAHALRKIVDGVGAYKKEPAYIRARGIAVCWSAYLGNRAPGDVKPDEKTRKNPILIKGTPYTGEYPLIQHYEREGWTADALGVVK